MTPENIKKRLQYWAQRGNKVCGPALLYIKKLEARNAEWEETKTDYDALLSQRSIQLTKANKRIDELKSIIDIAKVDPDADRSDPSIDNSYTGQIAQLKAVMDRLADDTCMMPEDCLHYDWTDADELLARGNLARQHASKP